MAVRVEEDVGRLDSERGACAEDRQRDGRAGARDVSEEVTDFSPPWRGRLARVFASRVRSEAEPRIQRRGLGERIRGSAALRTRLVSAAQPGSHALLPRPALL